MVDGPSSAELMASAVASMLILIGFITFIGITIWSIAKSFSKDKNKAQKARRLVGSLIIFATTFTAIGFNHDGIVLETQRSCALDVLSRECGVAAPGFLSMLRPWHDSISYQWGINETEQLQLINAKDRQIFFIDGILMLFGGLLITLRHRKGSNVVH